MAGDISPSISCCICPFFFELNSEVLFSRNIVKVHAKFPDKQIYFYI